MKRPPSACHERSAEGAALFAWSSGGIGYAREAGRELGLESLLPSLLPQPQVRFDDQHPSEGRRPLHRHPADATPQ
jgi:hypothetical protein